MKNLKIIYLFPLLFLLGCISSLKKDFPEKKFYIIEPDSSKVEKKELKFQNLKIINFRISNLFESKGLIYKNSDGSYEVDFYHEFLVPVNGMISEKIGDWFIKSKIVNNTTNHSRLLDSEFILEGYIRSIYGDFSDKEKPLAVLEMDFYLVRTDSMGIKMNKAFSKKVSIQEKTPEYLVKGWNSILTEIFLELTEEINKLKI